VQASRRDIRELSAAHRFVGGRRGFLSEPAAAHLQLYEVRLAALIPVGVLPR
jgi:hypothetical protein